MVFLFWFEAATTTSIFMAEAIFGSFMASGLGESESKARTPLIRNNHMSQLVVCVVVFYLCIYNFEIPASKIYILAASVLFLLH